MNFERDVFSRNTCQIVERQVSERSLHERQQDIYETHKHRAYAVAYYMVGNEVDAEEVTKDAFVRAFRAAEEPDGRCVDSALVSELRERVALDEQTAPATPAATTALGSRNVRRTDLEEAVGDLPPNERLVFLLRDVEGYDAERVATLLEVPRAQVERTLLSARIRIRGLLAQMERPAAAA